jgi:ATP-dependent helicase HrpA
MSACHEAEAAIAGSLRSRARHPVVRRRLEDILAGLRRLVPEHFVSLYDADRMADLVRYVRAAGIRADRVLTDPEKDARKALQVKAFTERLSGFLDELSPDSSEEKRRAVEAFFWMIEEYRVSVFSQELGTKTPVSEKRLKAMIREIERVK